MQKHTEPLRKETAHGYEFAGPLGATFLTISLPILAYTLYFACNDTYGCPPAIFDASGGLGGFSSDPKSWLHQLSLLYSTQTTTYVVLYFLYCLLLHLLIPVKEVPGTELSNGKRLLYKCNAWAAALLTLGGLFYYTLLWNSQQFWRYIWEHYVEFVTANIIISAVLATVVYLRSFAASKPSRLLASGGQTGNIIYDWFIGRELNPRVKVPGLGTLDIKFFCELRPGLLGWMILDLAFAMHQYEHHGIVSDSMVLVILFQSLYVMDSFYNEAAMLTTIDITTDGFGFMLAMGDLVCVPFIYSLPARYLAMHPVHLGFTGVLAVLSIHTLGYYIFRSSNGQKDRFRSKPGSAEAANLKYLTTSSGSKLLISGWWGLARHINYLGDWIMAWSWCLPTGLAGFRVEDGRVVSAPGFGMPVAYFYVFWLAVLLVHREMRDEEKCAKKYGQDWQKYKAIVRWRIIPWLY